MNKEEKESTKLETLIELLYTDRLSQYGKRKLVNYIEKQRKEIEEHTKFKKDIVSKIMFWDKEELPNNEAIIEMIDTLISEVSRLEDIEDKKVEVAVDLIEEKRDKFWKDKIRELLKKYDKDIAWANADDHYYFVKYINELLEEK